MATLIYKGSIALTRRARLASGAIVGAAPRLAATGASAGPKVYQNVVDYVEVARGDQCCGLQAISGALLLPTGRRRDQRKEQLQDLAAENRVRAFPSDAPGRQREIRGRRWL